MVEAKHPDAEGEKSGAKPASLASRLAGAALDTAGKARDTAVGALGKAKESVRGSGQEPAEETAKEAEKGDVDAKKGFSVTKKIAEKVEAKLRKASPDTDFANLSIRARRLFAECGVVGSVASSVTVSIEGSDPLDLLSFGADESWGASIEIAEDDFAAILDEPALDPPSTPRQIELAQMLRHSLQVLCDRALSWKDRPGANGAKLTRSSSRTFGFVTVEMSIEADVMSLLSATKPEPLTF